jgi:hypothetical protein
MRNLLLVSLLLLIILSCGEASREPEYIYVNYCPVEEFDEEMYRYSNPNTYYMPPQDSVGDGHSCAHEMNELCRDIGALTDAGLFNEKHYRWLCYTIGRDRFKCWDK